MSADASTELIDGAEALQAGVREDFVARLPALSMSDFPQNLSGMAARFVLERQTDALRSAVVLARNSLGHLALPFVRPACEERIWAEYLYSLEELPREHLLFSMSLLESTKTLIAQQQYLGSKEMKRLGFPKPFVNGQSRSRKSAEADLKRLGVSLGWPDDARPLPSVAWVAEQVNLEPLYAFLYSASSKGVHFSPYEVLRSGWSTGTDPDAPVVIMAEPYMRYRAEFSLHWLSVLLIETMIALTGSGPLGQIDLDEEATAAFYQAAERVGSAGRVPIALAAEFNLPFDRPGA